MKMISIDTPGWWDATAQQNDWIPLIMTKQSIAAVEHALNIYAQKKKTSEYLRGADFTCAFNAVFSPPQTNIKYERGIMANDMFVFAHLATVLAQTADIWRMFLDLCPAC